MASLSFTTKGGKKSVNLAAAMNKSTTLKSVGTGKKSQQAQIEASNARSKAQLAGAGVADPTANTEPTTLDRILMPFQAGQQVAGTLLDLLAREGFKGGNRQLMIATTPEEKAAHGEVWIRDNSTGEDTQGASPVQAFTDAMGGKRTISGAQVVGNLEKRTGVDTPGGEFGQGTAGFLFDIFTDPMTFATLGLTQAGKSAAKQAISKLSVEGIDHAGLTALGYADDAARALVEQFGDDAGRIAASRLPKSAANELAAKVSVDAANTVKNGRGLLGTAGKAGDIAQEGLTRASLGIKDAALKAPGGELLAKAFSHGNATEAYMAGNSIQRTGYDFAKRALGGALGNADHLGAVAREAVDAVVPDPRTRSILSLGISRVFGDVDSQAVLAKLAEGSDNAAQAVVAAEKAGDQSLVASARSAADNAAQRLAEATAQAYDPSAIASTLEKMGVQGADLENATRAAETVREHMAALLEAQKAKGVPVKDLFGADSAGYLPGMAPTQRPNATLIERLTGKAGEREVYNQTMQEVAQELGINADELRQGGKTSEFLRALKPSKSNPKTYLNIEARLKGIERGTTEAVAKGGSAAETDVGRLVAYATTKAEGRLALADFQKAVTAIAGDDAAAANLLMQAEKTFTNDAATEGFFKVIDAATGVFKKQATVWRMPAFQLRNKMSNLWLLGLNDGLDAEAYGHAPFIIMGKDADHVFTGLGVLGDMKAGELVDDFARPLGVVAGKGRSELYANQVQSGLTKLGQNLNSLVEDADRLTAFVAGLRKGMTPEAAAHFVDSTLYSYDAQLLTQFERMVMRRAMPFYIWQRRNLPHMMEMLVKRPGFVDAADKLAKNMQNAYGVDDSIVPDWIRESGYVPIKFPGQKDPTLLTLQGILPMGDLSNLKPDASKAFGTLNPYFIKDPFEMMANTDMFLGGDLEQYAGEKRKAPGIVNTLDRLLGGLERPLIGAEERTNPITGEKFIATNNRYFNKAVRDLSPFLGQVGKVTSPRDDYELISALTGLRGVSNDVPAFQRSKAYDDQAALQELITRLKAEGRMPKTAPKTGVKQSTKKVALSFTKKKSGK